MIKSHKYLKEIIRRLKSLKPYKIILFGSLAAGRQSKESDVDLMVILDSDKVSESYEDKLKNKIIVRKSIYELSKKIPIDLLVYTKAEYEILLQNESSFIKEIEETGKKLYEKADRVLA